MPTVREKLYRNRDSIACNACGNCCQGITCPCKRLKSDGRCSIHPKIVGVDEREKLEPDCSPDTDAVEVMLEIGYFCPPVADVIEDWTGIKLEPVEVKVSRMQLPIRSHRVFADAKKLEEILDMEL